MSLSNGRFGLARTAWWFAILVMVASAPRQVGAADDWPQWRGPRGTGAFHDANPPVHWDEQTNVRWKTELPGLGHSTPVIWDDRVYLTSATPIGEPLPPRYSGAPGAHDNRPVTHRFRFDVLAIDRDEGQVVWSRTVQQALPHEGGHFTSSMASNSPVTNGQLVVASFGSRGVYCLDQDGNVRWTVEFGRMNTKHGHGEGSSLALDGDTVIVNWDHEGQSFIAAMDLESGRERWRVNRPEVTSWSSPIVVNHDGVRQIVVCGTHRVRGYDLDDGSVIWECGGLSSNIVASPVSANGMVFVASSYDTRAMLAIRLAGAKGDITDTDRVVWRRERGTPYVPSLLLYRDTLYFLRHYQGILTRVRAATGEELPGPFRLGALRDIYASPVAADNRVYITDLDGATMVISHGEIPRVLAVNRLDDQFSASAAIVGNELFLRGHRHLYCLSEDK